MNILTRAVASSITLLLLGSVCYTEEKHSTRITDSEIRVISYEAMNYPPLALQTRVQGVVVVLLKLDNEGSVVDASALSGSDFLVDSCLTDAKKWKFQPNANQKVIIVFNFRLSHAFGCESKSSLFTLDYPNLVNVLDCVRTVSVEQNSSR
jgi:TonB family protein